MTVLGVAFTGVVAGVSAGLSVLCWPQRQQNHPARRLAFLAARDGPAGPARRRLRARFLKHLRHNPWSTARHEPRQGEATARICPVAADLLAACLASGADPLRAAEVVAYCLRPPGASAASANRPRPSWPTGSKRSRTCSGSAATRSPPGG